MKNMQSIMMWYISNQDYDEDIDGDYNEEYEKNKNKFKEDIGYDQSDYNDSDSEVDSHESIDQIYEDFERKQDKVNTIKKEIMKIDKKKIVFNVFNVVNQEDFENKLSKEFPYIEYEVQEFIKDEECLVVEVLKEIGSDFLTLENEEVGPANLSIYLDENQGTKNNKQHKQDKKPEKKTRKRVQQQSKPT